MRPLPAIALLAILLPARADGIRTEIVPPFETTRACVTFVAAVLFCENEHPWVAPFAHADPDGRTWIHHDGASALVGFPFVVPAGSGFDVEAEVDVVYADGALVCLHAGPAPPNCTSGRGSTILRVSIPPSAATVVADPAVVARPPDVTCCARPVTAASAKVRSFAYTVS